MVIRHFENIERVLNGFRKIITQQTISKKTYTNKQGMISGEIEFADESVLSFMELKNTEHIEKKKYKYHYMDSNQSMIFRYDNAKHHPEVETFPHHKHTTEGIGKSNEPELIDVLTEIQERINKLDSTHKQNK